MMLSLMNLLWSHCGSVVATDLKFRINTTSTTCLFNKKDFCVLSLHVPECMCRLPAQLGKDFKEEICVLSPVFVAVCGRFCKRCDSSVHTR